MKEHQKKMDSTKITLNKEMMVISLLKKEFQSRYLYAAINHFEKQNSGKNKEFLDVEKCIQDT